MLRFLAAFSLVLVTACDQVKPLKMPTDTTKEGVGLFSGEKGYFDMTSLCGITQEEDSQKPLSCPTPKNKQDNANKSQPNYEE